MGLGLLYRVYIYPVSYTHLPEVLEEIPADLDLNPAPSYTALEMDPENPYLGYVFTVTFAEDEWVKEIRVRAPEDDEAEPVKGGYFTICLLYTSRCV